MQSQLGRVPSRDHILCFLGGWSPSAPTRGSRPLQRLRFSSSRSVSMELADSSYLPLRRSPESPPTLCHPRGVRPPCTHPPCSPMEGWSLPCRNGSSRRKRAARERCEGGGASLGKRQVWEDDEESGLPAATAPGHWPPSGCPWLVHITAATAPGGKGLLSTSLSFCRVIKNVSVNQFYRSQVASEAFVKFVKWLSVSLISYWWKNLA